MSFGGLLARFRGLRALVVGDLMLDEYVFGEATRISPEAPVMVVRQKRTHAVPGGAANVAANLAALGSVPTLVGLVGDDEAGRTLAGALEARGAGGARLAVAPGRPTTRKTRILADASHQVLRIDHEVDDEIGGTVESELVSAIGEALDGADVVLLSDYTKGALTEAVVQAAVSGAASRGIPCVANVKPRSAARYRGASLVQANRAEAAALLGLDRGLADAEASSAAESLRERLGIGALLLTLGGSGMAIASEGGGFHIPAHRVEVFDTAGAGDTVLATVALGLAATGSSVDPEVFRLAAATSAAVVRKVGVAVPSPDDLAALA